MTNVTEVLTPVCERLQMAVHADDLLWFSQNENLLPNSEIVTRIVMERSVVRALITAVIDNGGAITLQPSDSDASDQYFAASKDLSQIMAEVGACDEEWLKVVTLGEHGTAARHATFYLVYGNDGYDVAADSTYKQTELGRIANRAASEEADRLEQCFYDL